jgi:hypothetical protein
LSKQDYEYIEYPEDEECELPSEDQGDDDNASVGAMEFLFWNLTLAMMATGVTNLTVAHSRVA